MAHHLAVSHFFNGIRPLCALFCDQKSTRKVPLVPRCPPHGGGTPKATAINYFNKRAGLTWDCETYEMPNGCTALLPLCTSNPNSYTYYSTWAFFEKDGILYQLGCTPVAGYSSSTTEEDHAMLKQVLDGFAA